MSAILLKPIDGYRVYMAMKLHFTKKNYDFFKNNAKVRIKGEVFDNKNDLECFIKFTSTIPKNEILHFLIANFVQGNYNLIYNLHTGFPIYKQWKSKIESLSYNFQNDIEKIISEKEENNISSIFTEEEKGKHPLLFKMYLGSHISTETMCILQKKYGYIEKFDISMKHDIIWFQKKIKIMKYLVFFDAEIIKFNNEKIDKILNQFEEININI